MIILEEVFDEKGRYLGKVVVYEEDLTPEFLEKCRKDTKDVMGWKKYRKRMKEHGYDIE